MLFSKSYGKVFPEWGVSFPPDPQEVRYHIGSVMRLMVATVAWQQHVQGKLNV